jgi:LAO/AO transport system kinase
MEIADIFVVNKADREGADGVVRSIAGNLSLQTFAEGDWQPPILKTEASAGTGVAALWLEIGRFRERSAARRQDRRRQRVEGHLRELLAERLVEHAERTLSPGELAGIVGAIAARTLDPYTAADDIVRRTVNLQVPRARTPEPAA